MSNLDAALRYASGHWAVLPIWEIRDGACACAKKSECGSPGKHPVGSSGVKSATTDETMIRRWWSPGDPELHNIAIACGEASGLLVVDVDPRHGGDVSDWGLPNSWRVSTGGGGEHIYFRASGPIRNRTNLRPGVDVKGSNGYVLAPPSNHISGGQYSWLIFDSEGPEPAPEWLLTAVERGSVRPGDRPALEDDNAPIMEGERNSSIFKLACSLRRRYNDDFSRVGAEIEEANRTRCFPPLDDEELKTIVMSAFAQDHSDSDIPHWGFLDKDSEIGLALPPRPLTDDGNARRLIDRFGLDVRYTEEQGWYVWNEGFWVPDPNRKRIEYKSRELARELQFDENESVAKWGFKSQADARIRSTYRLAESDPTVRVSISEWDSNPDIVCVKNGIIELQTGELRPPQRDDYVTIMNNVDYDPSARDPEWDKILKVVTGGDDEFAHNLQIAMGYSLTGHTSANAFFMLYGPTNSGKSTFIQAMTSASGEYALAGKPELFKQVDNDYGLAGLRGKRLCTIVELPPGARWDAARIKALVTGDERMVRQIYGTPFTLRNRAKFWIGTNELPVLRDEAVWTRVFCFPFVYPSPDGPNPEFKHFVEDPASRQTLLTWMVRGAMEWYKTGPEIKKCQAVAEAVQVYREEEDIILQFMNELGLGPIEGALTPTSDVHMRYELWLNGNRSDVLGKAALTRRIKLKGYTTKVVRQGGKTLQAFEGLGWMKE